MRSAKAIKRCLALCFFSWSATVLPGCSATGVIFDPGEAANYPDVWERVLPEEMRTNIASYVQNDLNRAWPVFGDYAASVTWELTGAYHVDGAEYDDVILRFTEHTGRYFPKDAAVLYYSFFADRLLSNNGRYKFLPDSDIRDAVLFVGVVRKLSFIGSDLSPSNAKHYKQDYPYIFDSYIHSRRITLSNGTIYDATSKHKEDGYYVPGCPPGHYYQSRDRQTTVDILELLSLYKEGESFLPVGYAKEDESLESTWLLLQRPAKARYVSKQCQVGNSYDRAVHLYNYYEYSFLRTRDRVVPLEDGTFLFVGTQNNFPVFHIIRMHSDMSIPPALSGRYKWISYEDYVGIVNLYEKGLLFSGRNKTCPLLDVSHPHCVQAGEDGFCARMKGGYAYHDKGSSINHYGLAFAPDLAVQGEPNIHIHSCLNMGLRNYVRGDFKIHHCREGDKAATGFTPCDERTKE